jgi:glycosidase
VSSIFDPDIDKALLRAQAAALASESKTVTFKGAPKTLPYPYPSPVDWRDTWIYFLMIDRFNNPAASPAAAWNHKFDFRQGGTFAGVTAQLDYLQTMGVKALWLSPVLKSSKPNWSYTYAGYAAQDFLHLEARFGSDGTRETAEREFMELIDQAHARSIHVIVDIVINHTARVFDYVRGGGTVPSFEDAGVMNGALGTEPDIQWLNGFGAPRADWQNDIPPGAPLSDDDAVYPRELQQRLFFRRRGSKLSDTAPQGGFAKGDFGDMRQLVVEYDALPDSQKQFRADFGRSPVLNILIRIYSHLIAKYDIDGFRIDTVKYVDPHSVQIFGNAIREFAQSIGKQNFFTFGEIADNEQIIANFVGKNSTEVEGYGIDAGLDFPLAEKLAAAVKGNTGVEEVRGVFKRRKDVEEELLSSHGEAGRFFVSFLDNHDRHERFNHPLTPQKQVTLGLGLLFTLQGIPCLYYGTEQGLNGTRNNGGSPVLDAFESVREALWGKDTPFDPAHPLFESLKALSSAREALPALRYGRMYFREVSGNGRDFGHSSGAGGVVAYSRILGDTEVLIVANTSATQPFEGFVIQDLDLSRRPRSSKVIYSNAGTTGGGPVQRIPKANVYRDGQLSGVADVAAQFVRLAPTEFQIVAEA